MADISDLYPKPRNPLDTLTGYANLQNIQNQNRLFQQQFQTNLGLSEIAKEAVDSEGNFDSSKIPGLIAQHPEVSYGLMEAYHQAQALRQQSIQNQASQLSLAKAHFDALAGYLAPYAAIDSKATSGDIAYSLSHAGMMGLGDFPWQAQVYSTLPRFPNGQVNEAKVPDWARQMLVRVQDKSKQIDSLMPTPSMQTTPGGGMAPYSFPQYGQVQQVGPSAPPQAGPTTTVIGPDGKPQFVGAPPPNPYEQEYRQKLQSIYGGAPGNAPNGQPSAPQAAPPQAAPASNIAGKQSAYAPGYEQTMQAYAGMGTALTNRADQVTTNKGLLSNLNATLEQFTPGPGAKWTNEAMSAVNRLIQSVPGLHLKGVGTDARAAQNEFEKMAQQLAQSQFQQLGGTGANFQLESTISTSPNSALSKLGNKGIISLLQGNEDAIQTKSRAWQQFKEQTGTQDYGKFSTEFNRHFDPRLFQFQYLTKDEQQKLIAGMSSAQKNKLHQDALYSKQQGWIGGQ